ncbi:MAG: hypothetical protein JWN46_463 [Acidimicrobiales bacterium]|nr:hypothetical protein [Acidimicrobiales bacterium]
MPAMIWLRGLLRRRPGRTLAVAAGVAASVALLASIGAFLSVSKSTMTRRAAQGVPVDWQVEGQAGSKPADLLAAVKAASGVQAALPVGFASTTGLEATTGGTTQTTGPGVVLGIPASYAATFPGEIRNLVGTPQGVLVAQQTAANLHVKPGDTITIGRAGMRAARVRVDGVVELPKADSLFQKVGAPVGSQPSAPPDNVLLLPDATWHATFDPLATTRADLVRTQIHARLDHNLPGDPSAAFSSVTGRARNLEVTLAGSGLVGNNLGAVLDAARKDALYAQVLFLFLGLPGAVLAGLLTAAVAAAGADRRRQEQAILRARGATNRRLVGLATVEAVLAATVGGIAGLAIAWLVGHAAFGSGSFGATPGAAATWIVGAAIVGFVIAVLTVAVPAWRDARHQTVAAGRAAIGRATSPRWQRWGLDIICLAASAVVYWLTGRNGYQLVLVPEGVSAISVSYWAFAGPALLWVGAGLFTWRLADLFLSRGRPIMRRILRPIAGDLSSTVASSMSRERRALGRALALVALSVIFAASTAVFNATYQQQSGVDARLTNGADVTVTESPGANVPPSFATKLASVKGVKSVEPVQHRFAYVGADLQDLYGVRTDSIVNAGRLQNAYFQGGTAKGLMKELSARPDGILVSAETAKDFQLKLGDEFRLRLVDGRTKQARSVVFHYVGQAKEFPTAPKDSFMIANSSYVAKATGSDAVGAFLIETSGSSPSTVAAGVRSVVGPNAPVTDLQTSRRVVGSSLTAVDLAGLTKVELGFALVFAGGSAALLLVLGFAERRRSFAIAGALGARRRHLGAFVWSESGYVAVGGLLAGALVGWVLSNMLIKVLTGVFDPAPAAAAVPWAYLGSLTALILAAIVIAAATVLRRIRRQALTSMRGL